MRKDSESAMRMFVPGGIVLWHDYGRWEGVSRALDELDAQRGLGLRHIAGTEPGGLARGVRPARFTFRQP